VDYLLCIQTIVGGVVDFVHDGELQVTEAPFIIYWLLFTVYFIFGWTGAPARLTTKLNAGKRTNRIVCLPKR
jgi:4-amino-4-deoxy-L-arabinose transferase-like glycosyltransferase